MVHWGVLVHSDQNFLGFCTIVLQRLLVMKIGQCSAPPCAGRYFGKACGLMLYLLPKPLILALGELAPTLTMIETL